MEPSVPTGKIKINKLNMLTKYDMIKYLFIISPQSFHISENQEISREFCVCVLECVKGGNLDYINMVLHKLFF